MSRKSFTALVAPIFALALAAPAFAGRDAGQGSQGSQGQAGQGQQGNQGNVCLPVQGDQGDQSSSVQGGFGTQGAQQGGAQQGGAQQGGAQQGGQQGGQQGQVNDCKLTKNVVIVKVKADQTGKQGAIDQGAQATIIPVSVTLQMDASGQVDVNKMVQDADAAMQGVQEMPLQANAFQDADLPDGVRQIFDDADAQTPTESLSWRYWNPYGYYGYGYYPYYGYYSYYPSYYPYYGFYYNNYNYNYTWGYDRYYNDYWYNYYYWY